MALYKMRVLCADGDKTVAEWDPETISQAQLDRIEAEFNSKIRQGFLAADLTDGRNVLINKFNGNADILLIPRVQGG
jgi:hypothetical protein